MVAFVLDYWPCCTDRVDPEFLRLGLNYYDIAAVGLGSPNLDNQECYVLSLFKL